MALAESLILRGSVRGMALRTGSGSSYIIWHRGPTGPWVVPTDPMLVEANLALPNYGGAECKQSMSVA